MTNTGEQTDQGSLVDQAATQVQEAASTAQDKAVDLKEQSKSKLGDTLEQRTNEVGSQARKMAQALRRSGEQLTNEGDGQQVAGLAESAADRIEHLGGYLERTSGPDLVRDIEDFARRRPWMVAGMGLLAGLAASRFLKASSERRYGESTSGPGSSSRYGHGMSPSTGSAGDRYADERFTSESFRVSG